MRAARRYALFFAGLHMNRCTQFRDDAPWAMMRRHYNAIFLRDCATGMQTHEMQNQMMCTRGAIAQG